MRERFGPEDTLVLSMDIEGAEYEVIRALLVAGVACWLTKLRFEGHAMYGRAGARVFYAGAWTHHFSMSHPGAVHSGLDAALSLGVALDPKDFFLGRWYKDRPPSTARARAGDRDWKELLREAGGEWTCNSAANFPDGVYDAAGAGAGAEPPAFACAREEASAGRAARRDAKEYAGDFLSGLGGNAARPARRAEAGSAFFLQFCCVAPARGRGHMVGGRAYCRKAAGTRARGLPCAAGASVAVRVQRIHEPTSSAHGPSSPHTAMFHLGLNVMSYIRGGGLDA